MGWTFVGVGRRAGGSTLSAAYENQNLLCNEGQKELLRPWLAPRKDSARVHEQYIFRAHERHTQFKV